MNISQWKNGDRTFFSLEVDDRLLLIWVPIFHIGHTKYILGMVIDQLQSQSPPSLSST